MDEISGKQSHVVLDSKANSDFASLVFIVLG